jgi:hypothetical protein
MAANMQKHVSHFVNSVAGHDLHEVLYKKLIVGYLVKETES